MSQLEIDMVVLGDICRWPPGDIRAMSSPRRRRIVEALVERRSSQASPAPSGSTAPSFRPAQAKSKTTVYTPKGRKAR